MALDYSAVTLQATKPRGPVALGLAALGVVVVPVEEDEGNVDRFVASRRLVVERRTAGAFLKGIMDKTLFSEAVYLRENFALPVLVVEGPVDYAYTGFHPQAVRGALSSMLVEYGLSVVSTADRAETVALVAMMAAHEQTGIAEISMIPKRTAASLADMQRRMIEMLPGCGRVAARELLHRFGSVARVLAASEDELCEIRGIGRRKAREIRRVLTEEYEALDTERQLEDAIEAAPSLLLDRPMELIARQHVLFDDARERQVIDLVYHDAAARELVLVELKRDALRAPHAEQLRRYLDRAAESPLLRRYLEAGCERRGILATAEPCTYRCRYEDIEVRVVDRAAAVAVLRQLRFRRLRPA